MYKQLTIVRTMLLTSTTRFYMLSSFRRHFSARNLCSDAKEYLGVKSVHATVLSSLVVTPEWNDVVRINEPIHDGSIKVNQNGKTLQVEETTRKNFDHVRRFSVPERSDLTVVSKAKRVDILNKLEGDVSVKGPLEGISLNKVRGEKLNLQTDGFVKVKTNLEGSNVNVKCKEFHATRAMGSSLNFSCTGNLIIESLYAESFQLYGSTVHLGAVHGKGMVFSDSLQIDSIDGILNAECKMNIGVAFDTVLHGICQLKTTMGDVTLSIADASIPTKQSILITATARHITFDTSKFEVIAKEQIAGLSKTILKPIDEGDTRPKGIPNSIGKINIDEAAKETFQKHEENDAAIEALAENGTIHIHKQSWMDRIRSRFMT